MVRVIIVVREVGRLKPDYSLEFDLPEMPRAGDYISIHRPDKREPYGEDLIVRQIWWRLEHPETSVEASSMPKTGSVKEIFVECDPAIGPYSSDSWRDSLQHAFDNGKAEEFKVARFSVRESELTSE